MRLGLFVLLSLALCAAQTSRSEDYIPAPYFDEGENLSAKNCGNEDSPYRWSVAVRNTTREDELCSGIVISPRTVLITDKCRFSTHADLDDLEVSHIVCWWTPNDDVCRENEAGVDEIIEFPFAVFVIAAFKLVDESEILIPICLFNRDNQMGLEHQTESPYFEWQHFWIGGYKHWTQRIVTGPGECLKNLSQNELDILKNSQIPTKNILCLKDQEHNHGSGDTILVNRYKSRYFLRAIKFKHGNFYIDLLPYINQIAKNAPDIHILSMPQPKPPIEFSSPDNLSFPDCGRKSTAKSRRKRDSDDSSEDLLPIHHIFGGSTAQQAGHPWHSFIENELTGKNCGGTLISQTTIWTVSHCIYGSEASDFKVTLGLYDLKQRRAFGVQTREPSRLLTHPNFTEAKQVHFDVGLMIFDEKFAITDHVRPICLWNADSSLDSVAGTQAMLVGFGLADNYTWPDKLQEAQMPIIAHKECFLSKRSFFRKYLIPGDNFCVGYRNGTSSCNGDDGGSLSVEKDGRWFIRGISSLRITKKVVLEGVEKTLCDPNFYSLYTDVASYMDWIVDNTPDITSKN